MAESKSYDITISFDTTGSMYSCISEVRRNIEDIINRLFTDIPNIRVSIVAHGDYCDEHYTYLMKFIDLTTNKQHLIDFVKNTGNTGGGDTPEAYEYVLQKVQNLSWSSESMRALVMIGDAYPHEEKDNPYKINWRNEVGELKKMGINIYSVQALNSGNGKAYTFYKYMAQTTNGYHISLDQFSYIKDILMAVCFKQMSDEQVTKYEQEVQNRTYGMTLSMRKVFDTMLNRAIVVNDEIEAYNPDDDKLNPCPPAKYQILSVDKDVSIKDYVLGQGLTFKTGKGFYEFTKSEHISDKKLIVAMKKDTGELFEGSKAKKLLKIDTGKTKNKPSDNPEYRIFIQSTSVGRKLVAGTGFLYEAADWGAK